MIDVNKENRQIKRKLIYNILIPENIGQLESSIIFQFAKDYASKPFLSTIKSSKLLTDEEKKKIKKRMGEDPAFKEHRNKSQRLENIKQTKIYEDKLYKEVGKDEMDVIWPYIKYFCEIAIEDDTVILDEEYEDYK